MRIMKFLATTSLLCLPLFVTGCTGGDDGAQEFDAADIKPADPHDHEHAAPHGGHLIEIGEHEFNVEVLFDEDHNTLTLYILGPHAETAVPVAAETLTLKVGETSYDLAAKSQEGDPEGSSSRFVVESEELIAAFHDGEDVHGTLQLTIGEKEYPVEIAHHEEDEHDHEEGHDHGDEHKHEEGEK